MLGLGRHIYRELAKEQRQRYERGEITWKDFEKFYRINAKNNARLYRKEQEEKAKEAIA